MYGRPIMKWTYDPTRSKYSRELLEPIVKNSRSYYEIIRKVGLKPTGSANGRIRVIIAALKLDTSHFLGLGSNCGVTKVGGQKKIPWQEILVYDRHQGRKEHSLILRRALLESGVEEKCEECGQDPLWNRKPLRLQIDHRNGDCIDNRPGNPRFLCPNCHAQTSTFGSNNMTKTTEPQLWRKPRQRKKRVWKNGHRIQI